MARLLSSAILSTNIQKENDTMNHSTYKQFERSKASIEAKIDDAQEMLDWWKASSKWNKKRVIKNWEAKLKLYWNQWEALHIS